MTDFNIESLETRQLFSAGCASALLPVAIAHKAVVAQPMFKRPIVLIGTYSGTAVPTQQGATPTSITIDLTYQRRSSLRGTGTLATGNGTVIFQFSGSWDINRNISIVFSGGMVGTANGKFSRDLKTVQCNFSVTVATKLYTGLLTVVRP